MMPLGIRCSAVFTPLITSVCPALWPPWKRTTPCAISVSQSTSLPLPSSPHWVPTTATLRPLVFVIAGFRRFRKSGGLDPPFGAFAHELAVAVEFVHFAFVAGQHAHDRLAPRAQRGDRVAQGRGIGVVEPWRADRGLERRLGRDAGELFHVEAEADRRTVASEHGADLVVAAAAHERVGGAGCVDGEARAAVVSVAAQVGVVVVVL